MNANYIVVGVRRAGKSTLLYSLVQDLIREGKDWNQIIYINFEDDRLSGFSLSDFDDIISIQKELSDKEGWFFFDEIQNIDGWEKFARRMADGKEHVFITGSNSKMLSSEMESKLGGRYLTKYVTPYSFAEYLDARKVNREDSSLFSTKGQGEIRKAFNDYFYYGGLPETLILKNKREYTSNVYSKITLGDIVARNNIRNINGLNLMIKKMAQSVKDNGFLNLFLVSQEPRLLENLVAIILKSKYGRDFYYIKTDSLDIDFFVPSTGEVIQVAYSITNISSERETESLVKAKQTLKEASSFRIITFEEEENLSLKGVDIAVTPIWKFALYSPKSKDG